MKVYEPLWLGSGAPKINMTQLCAAAVILALLLLAGAAVPALADGGSGGRGPGDIVGAGGSDSAIGAGSIGGNAQATNATGGGGGGAGATGGAGGTGSQAGSSGTAAGGAGGASAGASGSAGGIGPCCTYGGGGDGGSGGSGIEFTGSGTLNNSGSITGGNGGAGGTGDSNGAAGGGGAGVVGGGLAITNSGTITGGLSGDGVTRANAITFTGGINSLTLQSGSTITGNVVAFSSADTLVLGGSANAGFAVSNIGAAAQYQGFGVFQKTGSSTWALTGTTSATTNWTVSSGMLLLTGAGNLGSTAGAVTVAGGTLDLGGTTQTQNGGVTLTSGTIQNGTLSSSGTFSLQSGTISAALAGSGALTKSGTGTLFLDGTNTYTGGTTVSGGTLEVGDIDNPTASIAGDATVGAGGTLAGHGTVGGNVLNMAGGIVAPGGTIGTLNVGGNYTQGAGSTLSIEVSPSGASKLNVTGTASLAGTLALVYDPGVYTTRSYDILHAGSVTGTFSTVTGAAVPGTTQAIDYTGTDVDLALSGTGALEVAPTNDTVFGATETAALLTAQQATTMLFGHLADLESGTGGETIHTALASTSPVQVAFGGGDQDRNGLLAGLPDAMGRLGGWFRATGDTARLSGSGGMPGFDTKTGGFLAGIDRPIRGHTMLGVAVGYSHTNLSEDAGSSGTLDTPRLMLYGSYRVRALAFDATLGYAYDRLHATRPIAVAGESATSTHDGHEAIGAVQATRRIAFGRLTLLPVVGLQYARLFDGSFSETGSPGFDLSVPSRDAESMRYFLGTSASRVFTTDGGVRLITEMNIAYRHELMNTLPSVVQVGGGSFTVDGLQPARDELALGAGLTATMSNRLSLYVDYQATVPTGNLFEQTVGAGVRYLF